MDKKSMYGVSRSLRPFYPGYIRVWKGSVSTPPIFSFLKKLILRNKKVTIRRALPKNIFDRPLFPAFQELGRHL